MPCSPISIRSHNFVITHTSRDVGQALKLSHAALEIISPGKVINLMSNDVNRFDSMSMFINAMWTAPLLVIIVGYLLWVEVRWAGMFGLIIVFIVVPIQSNCH